MAIPAGVDLTAELLNEHFGIVKRKTTDETVNNVATLQDDNDLVWAVKASVTYRIELALSYDSGTVADFKIGWSVPTGTTMVWHATGLDTALAYKNVASLSAGTVSTYGGAGAGSARWILVRGIVTASTTAGDLKLQWAQNTAEASDTKMLTGTYGVLTRI